MREGVFAALLLAAASSASAQTPTPAVRSDATQAVELVGLSLASFAPTIGGAIALGRGDPWRLGQYLTAYGFGAANLGLGVWGLTRWGEAARWEKAFTGVALASGVSNLALAIYATARRSDAESRPVIPVGELTASYLLGAGTLAAGLAEVADSAGDSRLGGVSALVGAINIGLAIYETIRYAQAEKRGVSVVPLAIPDARGGIAPGIGLRIPSF